MKSFHYARVLADIFGRKPDDEAHSLPVTRRGDAISLIETTMDRRAGRARNMRRFVSVSAVAAVFVAGVGVPSILRWGNERALFGNRGSTVAPASLPAPVVAYAGGSASVLGSP